MTDPITGLPRTVASDDSTQLIRMGGDMRPAPLDLPRTTFGGGYKTEDVDKAIAFLQRQNMASARRIDDLTDAARSQQIAVSKLEQQVATLTAENERLRHQANNPLESLGASAQALMNDCKEKGRAIVDEATRRAQSIVGEAQAKADSLAKESAENARAAAEQMEKDRADAKTQVDQMLASAKETARNITDMAKERAMESDRKCAEHERQVGEECDKRVAQAEDRRRQALDAVDSIRDLVGRVAGMLDGKN